MSNAALRSLVQKTAAEMQGDLAHRWSLAEIASSLYLSPSQVGRVFNDQIGIPQSRCWPGYGCGRWLGCCGSRT